MTNETYSRIIELFKNENVTCLNENLKEIKKNSSEKIIFKCNTCGEEYSCSYRNLLDPRRVTGLCIRCSAEKIFIERLKKIYGRNPYEFKSQFKTNSEKLKVKCKDCGFEFEVNKASQLSCTHNLPEGAHPCKQCSKIRLKKNKEVNIENFKNKLVEVFGECNYSFPFPEKFNGIYSKIPFLVICNKCGNEIYTLPNNIIHATNGKHYCKNCNPTGHGPSKKEEEIRDFIKELINENDIVFNSRSILDNNLELDIFIKSKNIAIEFDGSYWHSEEFKGKTYHLEKTKNANSKNIRLVHIFEDEWTYKKGIVKTKIKNILNLNDQDTIFARKCIIKDIDSKTKNTFLNNYHIQGEDKSNISKGLFYNDNLVAVMTFSKLRNSLGNKKKDENKNIYELSRYATKYHIPGGFSKLFKNIINEYPAIETVITYADLRWSDSKNNIYEKNGFILKHQSKPNYWYVKGEEQRYHRYNFRKQVLKEKFPEFYDDSLTEHQIMDKTNYRRIWDCGNLVYEWKRKDD